MGEEEIRGIIVVRVAKEIREATLKFLGLVKTVLIKEFDRRYAAITQVVVSAATTGVTIVGFQGGDTMQ